MATIQLTQSTEPEVAAQPPRMGLDTSKAYPEVNASIDVIRKEIDDAFEDMKTFINLEPDEIMRMCSGHSARLSEIRVKIYRIEDFHRQWRPIRVNEVEPALKELESQFNTASRLLSARDLDYRMERGNP